MNKLWVRLSAAFLVIVWLAIAVIALVVQVSTARNFRQYLNRRDASFFDAATLTRLEDYYVENGSWDGVESLLPGPKSTSGSEDTQTTDSGSGAGHGQGQGQGQGAGQGRGGAQVVLADAAGVVVASSDETRIGTTLDKSERDRASELKVDETRVGWLLQDTPGAQALGTAENNFLHETTISLALAAAGAALLAVVIGIVMSWQLTRPMHRLTEAAHQLAAGKLGHQVETSGAEELVDLAHAFNRMSSDLAAGEVLRQHMAANIAHELRTPVSVLRGHLEAMLDGVFPLDAEHLAVAYDRTIHLSHLVDDLRLLTRAEAGQLPLERAPITPADLIGRAVESFAPLTLDAEIALEHSAPADLPLVLVDADRLQQVLGNLLTNALRHTPPGGRIGVDAARQDAMVRFTVFNTGTVLTPEQATHVFTPFWRAEDARERDRGGIGLGLAIAQQILALHGGRLWVEPAPDGTRFVFDLPAQTPHAPDHA